MGGALSRIQAWRWVTSLRLILTETLMMESFKSKPLMRMILNLNRAQQMTPLPQLQRFTKPTWRTTMVPEQQKLPNALVVVSATTQAGNANVSKVTLESTAAFKMH